MWMAAQNDHLKKLHAARMQAVKGRREVADILTENFRRGHTEDVRDLFIKLQDTIEAIDRAILDEERMTADAKEPEIPPG
jgi:hypothetical protein